MNPLSSSVSRQFDPAMPPDYWTLTDTQIAESTAADQEAARAMNRADRPAPVLEPRKASHAC